MRSEVGKLALQAFRQLLHESGNSQASIQMFLETVLLTNRFDFLPQEKIEDVLQESKHIGSRMKDLYLLFHLIFSSASQMKAASGKILDALNLTLNTEGIRYIDAKSVQDICELGNCEAALGQLILMPLMDRVIVDNESEEDQKPNNLGPGAWFGLRGQWSEADWVELKKILESPLSAIEIQDDLSLYFLRLAVELFGCFYVSSEDGSDKRIFMQLPCVE